MVYEVIQNFYEQHLVCFQFLGISSIYLGGLFAFYKARKSQEKNRQNIREFDFYLSEFKRNESFDNADKLHNVSKEFILGKLTKADQKKLENILFPKDLSLEVQGKTFIVNCLDETIPKEIRREYFLARS